jgi:hypothetical protein
MNKQLHLCVWVFLAALSSSVHANSIDLNDFWADPTVTIAADGASALLEESDSLGTAFLSNDPFLGDPEVILAGPNVFLTFDYVFLENPLGDDEFGAWVIDPSTGLSLGAPLEFFLDTSGAGTISFDLTALTGMTGLGLQFQLSSLPGDADFNSSVEISNLRLETVPVVPVPAAATLAFIGFGVIVARRGRGTMN